MANVWLALTDQGAEGLRSGGARGLEQAQTGEAVVFISFMSFRACLKITMGWRSGGGPGV